MLDEHQAGHGLTVLTRLAQRAPARRLLLRKALEADLVTLGPLAVRVGLETGEPMISVLGEALAGSDLEAEAAAEIAKVLPVHTMSMRKLAVQVLGARVRSLEPGSPGRPEALTDYAQYLADTGDAAQGSACAREAVTLLGEPGSDQARLARALWTASRCELMLGAIPAAARLARRSVAVQRKIAGATGRSGLAFALLNQAEVVNAGDDSRKALALYREVADILRALISAAPRRLQYQLEDAGDSGQGIWVDFTPGRPAPPGTVRIAAGLDAQYAEPSDLRYGLAAALQRQADLLIRDQPAAAAAAAGEAAEILDDLAADQRDAYQLYFARALTSQAAALAAQSPAEALPPACRAAAVLRDAGATARADADAALSDALILCSLIQVRLQLWDDALATAQELDALDWLDQHNPDRLDTLAREFEAVTAGLAEAGRPADAAVASGHAVSVLRRIRSAGLAGNADAMLGRQLHNLSSHLADSGDGPGVLTASAESMALMAPVYLQHESDPQTMIEILWQYMSASGAAGRPPDIALPLAEVMIRLLAELDSSSAEALAILAFHVIDAYRADGDVATSVTVLSGLFGYTSPRRDESIPRQGYALAAFKVVQDLLGAERVGEAEAITERLAELSATGDDVVLRETGKAAFVVLGTYVSSHDLTAAARVARLAETALRSAPYLADRREDLREHSPGPFLARIDQLIALPADADQAPAGITQGARRRSRFGFPRH
jgi:hypothetical protein